MDPQVLDARIHVTPHAWPIVVTFLRPSAERSARVRDAKTLPHGCHTNLSPSLWAMRGAGNPTRRNQRTKEHK